MFNKNCAPINNIILNKSEPFQMYQSAIVLNNPCWSNKTSFCSKCNSFLFPGKNVNFERREKNQE